MYRRSAVSVFVLVEHYVLCLSQGKLWRQWEEQRETEMVAGMKTSGWNSGTNIRRPGQDLAAEFFE